MFVEVEFEWTVLVQPDAMKNSHHIHRAVVRGLMKDFNDVKCTAEHGYHVALTDLEDIGEGRLWERRGCAAFPVRFRCLVFNLFDDEHVFAIVTEAHDSGLLCQCGPIETLFVPEKSLKEYTFLTTEVDSLIVSKWQNMKSGATIKRSDVVRVRIVGTQWDPAKRILTAVGSVLGGYVGVDARWPEKETTPKSNFGGESSARQDDEVWGDPVTNEDASGWGGPDTNEDNNAVSGWDC